jgi:hypothetical protein
MKFFILTALAFITLTANLAFASDGTWFSGSSQFATVSGAGMLTIKGNSAKELFKSMNKVKAVKYVVDDTTTLIYKKSASGIYCAFYSEKKAETFCVIGLSDTANGTIEN